MTQQTLTGLQADVLNWAEDRARNNNAGVGRVGDQGRDSPPAGPGQEIERLEAQLKAEREKYQAEKKEMSERFEAQLKAEREQFKAELSEARQQLALARSEQDKL